MFFRAIVGFRRFILVVERIHVRAPHGVFDAGRVAIRNRLRTAIRRDSRILPSQALSNRYVQDKRMRRRVYNLLVVGVRVRVSSARGSWAWSRVHERDLFPARFLVATLHQVRANLVVVVHTP